MKKMMDIREKILKELDQRPEDMFSVSALAQAVGSNNNATSAALSKLFKAGLVERPQKGVYSSKGRPPEITADSEPTQAQKPAETKPADPIPGQAPKPVAVKTPKPTPVSAKPTSSPMVSLSVVTIDLLVEGDPSKIDVSGLLEKVRGSRDVIDARVKKVAEADQSKLRVRFAFADET